MPDPDFTSRFNEIYGSTKTAVLSYVTAKCCNTADIQDIVQDVYVELYQILTKRGVHYIRNEKALVLRLARQKLSRYYSFRERMQSTAPLLVEDADGVEVEQWDLAADSFLTEDFAVDRVMLEEARRLLQQKPTDVKKVFYLFYDLGHSIPEIAQLLSMSESNVKHKIYRTLKELRVLLR